VQSTPSPNRKTVEGHSPKKACEWRRDSVVNTARKYMKGPVRGSPDSQRKGVKNEGEKERGSHHDCPALRVSAGPVCKNQSAVTQYNERKKVRIGAEEGWSVRSALSIRLAMEYTVSVHTVYVTAYGIWVQSNNRETVTVAPGRSITVKVERATIYMYISRGEDPRTYGILSLCNSLEKIGKI